MARLHHRRLFLVECTKLFKLYLMHTLSLSEFRAHASEMVDLVQTGETVRILRHGKAVAELIAVRAEIPVEVPRWKRPVDPIRYAKLPTKTGAQLIIDEREGGW
jgi:antitoxin (DNA-binding transcriptional repressor) of toxin-antitoxin stability system